MYGSPETKYIIIIYYFLIFLYFFNSVFIPCSGVPSGSLVVFDFDVFLIILCFYFGVVFSFFNSGIPLETPVLTCLSYISGKRKTSKAKGL